MPYVTQAPHKAVIYGFADAGAHITVSTDDGIQWGESTADQSGRFSVELVPQQAGGPHTVSAHLERSAVRLSGVWLNHE